MSFEKMLESNGGLTMGEVLNSMKEIQIKVNKPKSVKHNYEVTKLDGVRIVSDMYDLFSMEDGYFNITPIARQFGKESSDMTRYFKGDRFKEYALSVWDYRQSKGGESATFKKGIVALKKARMPLKKTVKGKYGGTYLHRDIVIEVCRWINPRFAVELDQWIMGEIVERKGKVSFLKGIEVANKSNPIMVEKRGDIRDTNKVMGEAIDKVIYTHRDIVKGAGASKKHTGYYLQFNKLIHETFGLPAVPKGMDRRNVYSFEQLELVESIELDVAERLYELKGAVDDYHEYLKIVKNEIIGFGL